jgi:isoprenylcysteine carboxyl methyltransferase (ICMT) family protein YpbQ
MDVTAAIVPMGLACLGLILAEWRLHRANMPFLRHVGAQEWSPRLVLSQVWLQRVLPFLAMAGLACGWWRPAANSMLPGVALALIGLTMGVKIAVMQSLGRLWSWRGIYIPGMSKTRKGLFHYGPHPEYVARMIEGIAFILLTGAWVLTPLWLLSGGQTLYMARLETYHIRRLTPQTEKAGGTATKAEVVEY